MKGKLTILICAWSALFVAWVFANPPSGTIGITTGIISSDSAGKIGITTAIPVTALDINGTTTIRKSLTMVNNKIINLATPSALLDAANKAYTDAQIANIGSAMVKIWGQGRPNASVLTVAGVCGGVSECYKDVDASGSCNAGDIKIARSNKITTWDRSPSVCPANWWVCSAAERDVNGTTAGYGSCGSVTRRIVDCDPPATLLDELFVTAASAWAWVSDPSDNTTNAYYGRTIPTTGAYTNDATNSDEICAMLPVWCCS